MATMKSYKVTIDTIGGKQAVADDAVVEGQGVAAYGALKSFKAVNFTDASDNEIYIPYHAIDHVKIETSTQTYTPPVDPTCA